MGWGGDVRLIKVVGDGEDQVGQVLIEGKWTGGGRVFLLDICVE